MLTSPAWARTWSILRLLMAVAILAAIITQLVASVTRTAENGQDVGTVVANFFSFFTILSNVGSVGVLTWAAIWYFRRGRQFRSESRGLAITLASVTTYMIVTGVVYNLLLRGIELPQGAEPVPWSNETLHVVGPIFLLVDLFVGPLRRRLPWRNVLIVIAFPIVWVLYTLVRGPLVTNPVSGDPFWYPYPFLNPNNFDLGYFGVLGYVVGIAAVIVGIAFFVIWIGRRRGARRSDRDAAAASSAERPRAAR
ncbi:MAG: Pr6Pr family membrane protein [Microbacterium pygmaeum]